ncbi:hypothetical protein LG047_19290 [Methylocystis sp. WRRC1]|uniref:hypothetical protein n=1 Tax=Methylocystis sp. WRRC1 TaxID=1732014 RepID=UPI001D13EF45|nr:hypothetical protein [Methylocystis sp. WRRC1]MCC3247437.1 hypothetical protein [Methylocystis sp. WRRC1]
MAIDDLSTLYRRARASGFDDSSGWDFTIEMIEAETEALRAEMKLKNFAARVEMLGGRPAVDTIVKGLGESPNN